jgi:hypothetical protein
MTSTAQSLSWMLTSSIRVTEQPDTGGVRVQQLDGCGRACLIGFVDDDRLTFNGEYVDVGDDYPRYLGIMDAVLDSPSGTIVIDAQ